jgi:hypothetical protein
MEKPKIGIMLFASTLFWQARPHDAGGLCQRFNSQRLPCRPVPENPN